MKSDEVMLKKFGTFCEAIKISHSVFALPFAVAAAFLASKGVPPVGLLGKIVVAVVLARTAAMSFNRWADADLDARNPRTRNRAIPAGLLSRRSFALVCVACTAGFVATTAWINALALKLSPIAVVVLLGYSYTKRFTSWSHIVLGTALGLSPLGAWVAVTGELGVVPAVLGLAVLFWTAGFDVIYACQDHDFDVESGLHSIPRVLGLRGALLVARIFHILAILLLAAVGVLASMGAVYAGGAACVAALLFYEHCLVKPDDFSRVNLAFFTLNGVVSLVFMSTVIVQTVL